MAEGGVPSVSGPYSNRGDRALQVQCSATGAQHPRDGVQLSCGGTWFPKEGSELGKSLAWDALDRRAL